MKILNENSNFLTAKKAYYGGVVFIGLVVTSSFSEAMQYDKDDRNSSTVGTIKTVQAIADTVLSANGHRTSGGFLSQGNHRSPSEWRNQGNHRTPAEWFSGNPSRNSGNAK